MATGMVNTTVAPSILPVSTPPSSAAWGSDVSAAASAPPPMSQASSVPANMAGSAPRSRYTGTITGLSTPASTGASAMMPSMAMASDPMERMPSSKGFPSPSRFPRIRSSPPSTAKAAISHNTVFSMSMLPLRVQNGHHRRVHGGVHAVFGGDGAGGQQDPR